MNITVFYAARREFQPEINKWPEVTKVYPFANFLRNYGWGRPALIMKSLKDKNTDLDRIVSQIKFDFGILKDKDLQNLQVCLERGGKLVGMCNFCELKDHSILKADKAIIKSPDGKSWYVIEY